jgi:putative glutamine amidotransferase
VGISYLSQPPLIGVSTSEVRLPADHGVVRHGEPPRSELALGETYLDAVRKAGGLPVILAPVRARSVDALLDRLDALCLSGGPDLAPVHYGADAHPDLGPTQPELDRFELALARRAMARGLPVLAICRGMQVLNVARGGTLHQHLPDLNEEIDHRQTAPAGRVTHEIELTAGSRLAGLVGEPRLSVNSFHHQALDELGNGLRVVARASDGIVEAVELPGAGFVIGVQWHAELLVDRPEQLALFDALVSAATAHTRAAAAAA